MFTVDLANQWESKHWYIVYTVVVVVIMISCGWRLCVGCYNKHPGWERGAASARVTQRCSSCRRNGPQHPQNWRHRTYSCRHLNFIYYSLGHGLQHLSCSA